MCWTQEAKRVSAAPKAGWAGVEYVTPLPKLLMNQPTAKAAVANKSDHYKTW